MDFAKILELISKDFSFSRENDVFTLKVDNFSFSTESIEELLTVFGDFVVKGITPKQPEPSPKNSEQEKFHKLLEEVQRIMRETHVPPRPASPFNPRIVPMTPNPRTGDDPLNPFQPPWPQQYPWFPKVWCSFRNLLEDK